MITTPRMPLLATLLAVIIGAVAAPATASSPRAQDTTAPAPAEGTEKVQVKVSFLLIDLFRIIDAEQAVEADLFYRVEWYDERSRHEDPGVRTVALDSIWTPRLEPVAPRSISKLLPELAVVQGDGTISYTQRVTGRFGAPTYLADFPFDSHTLEFPFFFVTGGGLEMDTVEGPIVEMSKRLTIPDWKISDERLSLEPISLSEDLPPVQAATLRIKATRVTSHYIWSVIFPLIVIVMMSWTVFWAPPAQINVQFGFAATSILTVIAYRFALASQIPPVPYATRLESFLNGAFVLAFLALVEVIATARLIYRDRTPAAERVDYHCRWVFPTALTLVGVYAFGY